MKKILLALCVCAGLCACSSDDDLVGSTSTSDLEGGVAYLTVSLNDVNSSTRATSGGFAYGTEAEQKVNNAYFYLYDAQGNYMAKGSLGSITGTSLSETSPVNNIEWQSGNVVAVYGLDLDEIKTLPTQMLTVLNQPSSFDASHLSLEEATTALAGTPYADANGNFVMSTSVYGGENVIYNTTALTDANFCTEPVNLATDYAESDKEIVNVYVERLAAKVTANVGDGVTVNNDGYIDITTNVASEFVNGAPEGGVYVKLLGFDVDCVARDAYMSKNIQDDSNWSGFTFTWNGATNYRSYWAESPNYGDDQVTYPTSSNGNDADAEDDSSTWLNKYLRYVDLKSPITLGGAAYCGENTNTTTVIGDSTSSALTNLLVKGQVYTKEGEEYVPLDLVEYHGMYYTAEDFCNTTVADVVEYDFTYVIDETIGALKTEYPTLATYLDDLKACVIKDNVWVIPAVENHMPTGTNVNGNQEPQVFDGSLLSLYNDKDGNVNMFYNMTTQPQWITVTKNETTGLNDTIYTNVDNALWEKYPASDIVYGGADLDNYEFMFHIYEDGLGPLEEMGLIAAHVIFQINGDYYMILGNNFSIDTESTSDPKFSGGHTYTLRNFLLRTITVEADGIDSQIGSHKPNLFADGMMYYNVPIEHLGTSTDGTLVEGEYGIVRNHYYNVTINSLTNFGRGIADLNEVIVPQPEVTYYYLGANIDILSWQMVNQSVAW